MKHQWSRDRECNLVSSWATLSADIYHNTNHYEDTNGRHLFIASVSRVFETMRLRVVSGRPAMNANERIAAMAELLSCMVDALRWSLVHSLPNCGAYTSLSWVKDIVQCYQASSPYQLSVIPLTKDITLRPTFLLILRLFEACLEQDLLTDKTTASNLKHLLELLEHPKLPDLPADLTLKAFDVQRLAPSRQVLNDPEASVCPPERATMLTRHPCSVLIPVSPNSPTT